MNNEEKIKKLNEYKKMIEDVKKAQKTDDNIDSLSNHFKLHLKSNHTRKLVKKDNGFTNVMVPIIITVFIIGFAIGIAFALYKF